MSHQSQPSFFKDWKGFSINNAVFTTQTDKDGKVTSSTMIGQLTFGNQPDNTGAQTGSTVNNSQGATTAGG